VRIKKTEQIVPMKKTEPDVGSRITSLAGERGVRFSDIAAALGVTDRGFRHYLQGNRQPSISKLIAIADLLGVTVDELVRPDLGSQGVGAEAGHAVIQIDGDEFAAVPRVAVEASAGGGAFNDEPEVVGKLAFRRDWLRKIDVKPEKAMLITVTGDSMSPDLEPGDLALIDQDRTEWEHNRVFALVDFDGGVRIKRILIEGKRGLVLVSDNAANHPPEVRLGADANRVRPLGRVVWSGHRWE